MIMELKRECMNTRAKGSRFEREVRKVLERDGYFCVRQAASAFPDLIAIADNKKAYFIECKVNKYITKKEKEDLIEMKKYGGIAVAWPEYVGRKKVICFRDPQSEKVLVMSK